MRLSQGRDIRILAALAWARAGDIQRARTVASKLKREFPFDTTLNRYWLPVIEAAAQLRAGDAARALGVLEAARQYGLGQSSIFQIAAFGPMNPIYLRREAFLLNEQRGAATTEFPKITEHPGLIQNFPLGALAHLELARAYARQQGRARAIDAYRKFLTLWKDADPGSPIVSRAKTKLDRLMNN